MFYSCRAMSDPEFSPSFECTCPTYCTTPRKRGGAFLRGGPFRARKFLSPSSRGGALAIPPVLRFAWGGIFCSQNCVAKFAWAPTLAGRSTVHFSGSAPYTRRGDTLHKSSPVAQASGEDCWRGVFWRPPRKSSRHT